MCVSMPIGVEIILPGPSKLLSPLKTVNNHPPFSQLGWLGEAKQRGISDGRIARRGGTHCSNANEFITELPSHFLLFLGHEGVGGENGQRGEENPCGSDLEWHPNVPEETPTTGAAASSVWVLWCHGSPVGSQHLHPFLLEGFCLVPTGAGCLM